MSWKDHLQNIYFDLNSPISYAGPEKIYKFLKKEDGFKEILQSGRKPKEVRTDPGSEWKNRWVRSFLNKQGIHHFVTHNITHANYAERLIRSLKSLMYRYFTHKRTYNYLDILPDLVRNYNSRPHSSLRGKLPNEVTANNEATIWKRLYVDSLKPQSKKRKHQRSKPFKFKVGDFVRLSSNRLVDYDGDSVEGTFYSSELQKVQKSRDDIFKVEKVLKRRRRNGLTEVLVKWLGYPRKFNSWIKESDLQDL
ncbi:uncharacterized protein LOC132735754 [Ruditapes philippinarum]|uniref:uncharacterized protein LOC132735754 n=1 Tax=Ruditapes philippinarum TaxID=129788 RepID=UPI00295C3628|nr:uncharacterized protein LOC132735754 [Ruditapes philippinarum]